MKIIFLNNKLHKKTVNTKMKNLNQKIIIMNLFNHQKNLNNAQKKLIKFVYQNQNHK